MAREFVRDPATGKPAFQVVNYEVVELETLQNAVTDAQNEYDAARVAHEEASARLGAAEVALNDSKSELESGERIASEPDPNAGPEATGGEDSSNPDGTPSFAQEA